MKEPEGEHKLHCAVVSYTANKYRDVIMSIGLGDHKISLFFKKRQLC